ncbi:sigma-70 family RNA polymerase sigma factor [Peptoniphilus obesi]|uniref:sigma-70 family RNA polymerase sigma factor n=1 Tax=Peptoniphilus obesi TaxID=1472765 RepID=UPI0004B48459|nr:sigma-70 family RNA polymerase sigma factor [Peptoniphilus obesi]
MDKDKVFKRLMADREDKLYRIAFSYVRNEDDAMDCLQNSLIKALENFDSLKNQEYFNTWMVRILINECIDFLRKRKDDFSFDEKISKDYISDNYDETIDLLDSLSRMSEDERELLYLRYFEDLSYLEISKRQAIKLGTVKSRLSRSLAKLKKMMGGNYES